MKRLLPVLVIACLFITGCTEDEVTPTWNTVVVDSSGNVGEYSSITIDGNGKAHIAYFDYLTDEYIGDAPVPFGNLKYASNAGGNWEAVTVYTGAGMLPRICIDGNENVHIIHSKLGASELYGILDLLYTTNETGSWETVAIGSQVVKGADSSVLLHIGVCRCFMLSFPSFLQAPSSSWRGRLCPLLRRVSCPLASCAGGRSYT